MRTLIILGIGLALLGLSIGMGRLAGGATKMKAAVLVFIGAWFLAAAANMYVGVVHAGYSLTDELPIFLLILAVPASLAIFLRRRM